MEKIKELIESIMCQRSTKQCLANNQKLTVLKEDFWCNIEILQRKIRYNDLRYNELKT